MFLLTVYLYKQRYKISASKNYNNLYKFDNNYEIN